MARFLSVLFLIGSVATPAPAQSRSRPLGALELARREQALRPYFLLVEAYRNRDLSVRDTIKGWTAKELQPTLSLLREIKGNINHPDIPARDWTPALVRAAVVLHLEALDDTVPTTSAAHRTMALGLLELLELAEDQRFKQRVLVLMTKQLRAGSHLHDALVTVKAGLEQLPDDPVLLTLAGTLHEDIARLDEVSAGAAKIDVAAHLVEGERGLWKALVGNPALDEARLRLSRLLYLGGRRREAVSHLVSLLASRDPDCRYLAHLFLGAIHEGESRFEEAESSYRAALRVNAYGQSAELALSALLNRQGKRAESRGYALSALRKAPRGISDSWWLYSFGPSGDVVMLELLSLREEVMR